MIHTDESKSLEIVAQELRGHAIEWLEKPEEKEIAQFIIDYMEMVDNYINSLNHTIDTLKDICNK
jgi:hypothetical protein